MDRRTSNYTLSIDTYGEDAGPLLDSLIEHVTLYRVVTNSRAYSNTVEVSFRAASDEDADAFADRIMTLVRVLASVKAYHVFTGLGVHRREVSA